MTQQKGADAERVAAKVASLIQSQYPSEGSSPVKLVSLDAVTHRRVRAWKWALLLPVPALAAAALLLYIDTKPLTFALSGGHLSPNQEVVADGEHESALRFSDGTQVALSSRSEAKIQAITAHGASVRLGRGRATAAVVHRPRARWYFLAGPFQIEVVGTNFSVDWQPQDERLELTMHNGKVRVTGPLVPDETFLTQGQRLLVSKADLRITNIMDDVAQPTLAEAPAPAAVAPPPGAARVEPPGTQATNGERLSKASRGTRGKSPSIVDVAQLVAKGSYAQALAHVQANGLSTFLERAPSHDLAALAEAARYEQNVDVARASLQAQRQRFARTRAGSEAAFHLGRLAEDVDNMPARAAEWFGLYLREQPTGRFASEGLGRQMVATSRMGDRAAARALAQEYVSRFPQGTYATVARQLAAPKL